MQKQVTRFASIVGIALAAFMFSGCSLIPTLTPAQPKEPAAEIEVAETEEAVEAVEADSDPAVAGELLQPGQTVSAGEWATYEYENYDGLTAVLQTRLVSVEPATQAQTDLLVSEIPELKGWNVALIRFQQQKVSGDDITYNANYTDFDPADVNGESAQYVSVIGWEDCETESFTEEFNAGTAVIDQCIIGAYVTGGTEIGGMRWTGNSSADENPFSDYEGEPVFFKA